MFKMKIYIKSFCYVIIFFFLFFNFFVPQLSAQVLEQDSLALIALYDSTNGDTWGNNSGWKTGPVSTWHGITLTANRVTQIILNYNSLSGKLPAEIGNLSELVILYINNNAISGTIPPQIGNLTNLVNLAIFSNNFNGSLPPELGNLSSLEKLLADHNNFTNSIPPQLGNLSSLLELHLDYNNLSGSIPPELGNLSNVTSFYLRNNQLSGSIPQELGNLSSVHDFHLGDNQLNGSIPDSLGNLNTMATFDLSNNQLSGNIPASLGNITSVGWGLMLHNNQLTGSIPSSLGNVSMQNISLYNNQLTGSIPSEIGSISNLLGIYLQNNQLTGPIPDSIFSLPNLQFLDLSYNQIADTISKDLAYITNLSRLYLNNNQLTGSIPPELGNAFQILRLRLNDNQLGDSIPHEIANQYRLTELYLHNNNFNYMPDLSNGNLQSSIDFKVEDNFLDFEDLEANANLGSNFTYSPQAVIGEQLDTLLYAGDSISFSLNAGGASSIYHWYKDSVEMHVSSDTFLVLDHVQIQNAGEYYCVVTNTIATQLTLFSRPFNLTVIDTTAPGIPQNLSAAAGDSMIVLSWRPNNDPDSVYYRIYMDTTSNPLILIDSTSNATDTTKIFYGLNNNTTYYLRLTAVDWSNNESGFSNEVFATPVYIDSIAPAIPQNLSGIAGDSSVTLTWNMVNDADSIYYRVYMDTVTNPIILIDSALNNADTSIVLNNLSNNTTYYCRVTAIDKYLNESDYSNEIQVTPISTGIDELGNTMPTTYSLEQNYPNPFNPVTTISYSLPKSVEINLVIYNILGQHIQTLYDGYQMAGFKKLKWYGKNDFGENVNSGVYFYQLITPEFNQVKKLILLR
jgi:Leucine-rich repeat (LRR) protein